MHVLGIDVGTGGTRATVIDCNGRVASSATEEHQPFASPQIGWAEQQPEDWWRASSIAVRQAIAGANLSAEEIACVGFSGQMHGAVMLDEQGSVVRPALIWCDVRTEKQCRDLTAKIGQERLIQLTCNPALANFTLTKLLWVGENEPENWKRVRAVMLPKDYVRFRLTGERATDLADASGTLLLDVAHRRWSPEMLEAAEIDERLLPALHESSDVCGQISSKGAAETGLRVGTPVVAGAGDQAAGATGMGIVAAGTVSATIGTSGVVFAATDRPALDPRGRMHTFCHAIPGRWHVMGVTQAAGLSLRWFRDNFAVDSSGARESYDRLTAEAAKIPAGSDGLLWTPYLMGERTPHLDSSARGALVGLTASHTRAHVVRAILEGVAFSLRDTFTLFQEMDVPVTNIRLGGGGARSPLWRQIQADIYGRAVEIVEADEGAAYGAAILAGVGAGMWSSVDAACHAVVRVASRVNPQPASVATLNASYSAFRRIYPATREIFNSQSGTLTSSPS
ncbi:MAG: xylulokinase [Acidobacteria bacterium]|nr:MAG: xylulokinase [Acidobacteriota bacterium]PYU74691.1 MAG: xylulokinase [Acidobacteriota bacterium]